MSDYKSWLRDYYSVPADHTKKHEALDHSIRKWEGLDPDVLKKHGMEARGHGVYADALKVLGINGDSCALCYHHEDCEGCPLMKARGGVPCDEFNGDCDAPRDDSPFHTFTNYGDPEPMIMWLKKAKEMQK